MLFPLWVYALRANGEPLISTSEPSPKVANVCLVQLTTIPSQEGRFVKPTSTVTPPEVITYS